MQGVLKTWGISVEFGDTLDVEQQDTITNVKWRNDAIIKIFWLLDHMMLGHEYYNFKFIISLENSRKR